MTTKTVTLDFGVPDVTATITFEEEPPRGPDACPMCSEATGSEPAFLTACSRCQDSATECSTCNPAVIDDAPTREANGGDGWWWDCMSDDAARMWDFK